MPLCLKCIVVISVMLPVGLLLRSYAERMLGQEFCWVKEGAAVLRRVREVNPFLWLLLVLEGVIANFALVGFIIGVPLYFWKGV